MPMPMARLALASCLLAPTLAQAASPSTSMSAGAVVQHPDCQVSSSGGRVAVSCSADGGPLPTAALVGRPSTGGDGVTRVTATY